MAAETLVVGFLLALLWAELTDVSPGGIIVPGYLALYAGSPLRIAATVAAALVTVAVYKFLARSFILFGRRRFVVMVLAGAVLSQAWFLVMPSLFQAPLELRVIGWLVPGILAANFVRQRFLPTLASALTVAAATFAVVRLIELL